MVSKDVDDARRPASKPETGARLEDRSAPLRVDLDGTIIYTDLLGESIALLLARKPWLLFVLPFWLLQGRAVLKRRLAAHVKIAPALLPYDEALLAWMSSEKVSGRQLILATASDYEPAQAVADHLGLFDEVVASNGRENCKGATKLKHLRQRFGVNFDYVGNSRPDLPIWMESRNAVVVRVSSGLQKKAQARARVTRIFSRNRGFANSLIKC